MNDRLLPALLVPLVAVLALPAMTLPTWIALTVAGAATGMMFFLMASGLTLIFGLMDVLNFAHAAFITLGAFLAVTVLGRVPFLAAVDSPALNLLALLLALAVAAAAGALAGWVFEAVIVRRVYGSHLQQVLITVGALIVAEQLAVVVWGAQPLPVAKPLALRGSFVLGGAAVETYRLVVIALGLLVWAGTALVMGRTRLGMLVRAGVENREMVEALGFRVRRLFVGVFAAGTALAAAGGVTWAAYQELVTSAIGSTVAIPVFIVVIIGGLGSVTGSFVGAVLVGLVTNYVGFLAPALSLGTAIAVMVAVLLWRPRGLFPVARG